MPGRTLTEGYLVDTMTIAILRARNPQTGVLEWLLNVRAQTADGATHEVMFTYDRNDLMALLPPQQQTALVSFANSVRDRLANALGVAGEKP